jgi:hypothetical protein
MTTIELIAVGIAILFVTLFVVPYGILFALAAYRRMRPPKK